MTSFLCRSSHFIKVKTTKKDEKKTPKKSIRNRQQCFEYTRKTGTHSFVRLYLFVYIFILKPCAACYILVLSQIVLSLFHTIYSRFWKEFLNALHLYEMYECIPVYTVWMCTFIFCLIWKGREYEESECTNLEYKLDEFFLYQANRCIFVCQYAKVQTVYFILLYFVHMLGNTQLITDNAWIYRTILNFFRVFAVYVLYVLYLLYKNTPTYRDT